MNPMPALANLRVAMPPGTALHPAAFAEVIGDPIAHSRSPAIHRLWLNTLAVPGDYRACAVAPERLAAWLERRRADQSWLGCNVTAPHKQAIAALVDRLSPAAARIGAVNCVCRDGNLLVGHNFDPDGIAEALGPARLEGRPVAIVGGGGAARAAIDQLGAMGAESIRLVLRDPARATSLDRDFGSSARLAAFPFARAAEAMDGVAAVINASPLGAGHGPAWPPDALDALSEASSDAVVFDMVYDPHMTALLRAAGRLRLKPVTGLAMLVGQARRSFQALFGFEAPHASDNALTSLLRTAAPTEVLGSTAARRGLALVGLPGAGKSTIGRACAERRGLAFLDSDAEIEREAGMPIADLFARVGEAAFRQVERRVVARIAGAPGTLVALGGGAFVDPDTRALVQRCCISLWLDVGLEVARDRVDGSAARPLFRGREPGAVLRTLAEERAPTYMLAHFRIGGSALEERLAAIDAAIGRLGG